MLNVEDGVMLHQRTTQEVRMSLQGLEMPASRQEILECARRNSAPASAIHAIEMLPDRRYRDMDQIMAAIGQLV